MTQIAMMVAAHKKAPMPSEAFYMPIHVGSALSSADFGYQPDATGENISEMNASYCELTAQYWAWKNHSSEYIGLSHYRRYFKGSLSGPGGVGILSEYEARELLSSHDMVLAKPRNYVVETIESHYANSHYGRDLSVVTRGVIEKLSPALSGAFEKVLSRRSMSLYNMFLMSRDELSQYSQWLFMVLSECEKGIDNKNRTAYEQRTFGYLAEILLNVWADYRSSELRIAYLPVVNTEGEPKLSKGLKMLKRKLKGPGASPQ